MRTTITNTPADKLKYLSHYGNDLIETNGGLEIKFGVDISLFSPISEVKARLRSLYEIKDEELIELVELMTGYEKDKIYIDSKSVHWTRCMIRVKPGTKILQQFTIRFESSNFFITDQFSDGTKINYLVGYQFLKDQKFALPYYEASVETLIEWGWLELI